MKNKKGFTLLELLIVVVIIAILSIAVLFVLNPAETLRKTRDAQRFADLSAVRNAIAIYVTSVSTPYLSGTATNVYCKSTSTYSGSAKIFYSFPLATGQITDTTLDGELSSPPSAGQSATVSTTPMTDGTGWIPVNLSAIVGGSPISNFPVDPVNTIASCVGGTCSSVVASDKVYRYGCKSDDMTFEIDATLESTGFTSDDDRRAKDGGNNSNFYEVGTNLQILGSGNDF